MFMFIWDGKFSAKRLLLAQTCPWSSSLANSKTTCGSGDLGVRGAWLHKVWGTSAKTMKNSKTVTAVHQTKCAALLSVSGACDGMGHTP